MDLFTPFIIRPKAEPENKQDIAIKKISAMPRSRRLSDKRKSLTAQLRARGNEDHIVTEGELVGINADAEDFTYDAHGHTHLAEEDTAPDITHVDVNEESLSDSDDASQTDNIHWDDWA